MKKLFQKTPKIHRKTAAAVSFFSKVADLGLASLKPALVFYCKVTFVSKDLFTEKILWVIASKAQ